MNRTYKTEGVVLKRLNYGEADRILTIYTKHYGKVKALAKGVRRVTSRKGGNVESFNLATLFFVRGKNLDLVTEASVINSFESARKNLLNAGLAYYFCELVDKLTPDGQANPEVFKILKEGLERIGKVKALNLVKDFEIKLLEELGFGVPSDLNDYPKSLVSYIETITEREIRTPKVLKKLKDW